MFVIVALFFKDTVSVSGCLECPSKHESTTPKSDMAAAAATHSPLSPSTASSPPSLSSSVSNALSRLTVESVPELQWETLPVRMEEGGRVGCAAAAVSRNELVVAGGSNGYLSILALAKLLNVDRNKWTDLPNMNNPRFCCGAATIATTDTEQSQPRRRVYVVGGVNKSGVVLSSVEVFDLSVDPPHWSVLKKNMSCGRWGSRTVIGCTLLVVTTVRFPSNHPRSISNRLGSGGLSPTCRWPGPNARPPSLTGESTFSEGPTLKARTRRAKFTT